MNSMLERLSREFRVTDIIERNARLTTLTVDKDVAETLIRELRDREGYTHLNFMTAIDYIERGVFTLVYMLHNYATEIDSQRARKHRPRQRRDDLHSYALGAGLDLPA